MSKASQLEPNTLVDPKFIGIPYKLGGREFDGADCIGVAILWFKNILGIEYEYEDRHGAILENWYERNPKRFSDAFLSLGNLIRFHELKKYDCLLLLWGRNLTFPSCLGVMVDDRHFLTTLEGRGSSVEMLNLVWKEKFWGGIRLHKIIERFGE